MIIRPNTTIMTRVKLHGTQFFQFVLSWHIPKTLKKKEVNEEVVWSWYLCVVCWPLTVTELKRTFRQSPKRIRSIKPNSITKSIILFCCCCYVRGTLVNTHTVERPTHRMNNECNHTVHLSCDHSHISLRTLRTVNGTPIAVSPIITSASSPTRIMEHCWSE